MKKKKLSKWTSSEYQKHIFFKEYIIIRVNEDRKQKMRSELAKELVVKLACS